jgi:hypothetical protein
MLTDVVIDPAGNVWAANNWNFPPAVLDDVPAQPTSTWGGASGFTVIYGVSCLACLPIFFCTALGGSWPIDSLAAVQHHTRC